MTTIATATFLDLLGPRHVGEFRMSWIKTSNSDDDDG